MINIKQERAVKELSSRILNSLFFSKSMVKSANIRRKKNRNSLNFHIKGEFLCITREKFHLKGENFPNVDKQNNIKNVEYEEYI